MWVLIPSSLKNYMNIITKKELLIISTILCIVVFPHLLLFLYSNQYICLNEVLQALLSMEFYVNKSQVEFELYTSKSSIDVDLFGKDQKMFYINESLISTEFNVMDDPINPMYKKVLYIVAGIIIVGGICYLGYPFFPPLSPDLSPSVTFLDKIDVLLYNSLDSTNILLRQS